MRIKAVLLSSAALMAVTITGVAAYSRTKVDTLVSLTGLSEDAIAEAAEAGKTLGEIAFEEGVYDQFKASIVSGFEAHLDDKVSDGKLSADEAADLLAQFEAKQADCTGDPSTQTGMNLQLGSGGNGQRQRQGK